MNELRWRRNDVYDASEAEVFVAERVGMHADERYQPSFEHKEAFEFMIPLRFENGLAVGDSKHYYDFVEAHSSFSRRIGSIHRPAFDPLVKQVVGKLPSCLRRGKRPRNVEPSRLQRSSSVSNLSSEALQSFAVKDMPVAPKVRFHDFVLVKCIPSFKDYPSDVRQSIWISKDELSVSMRQIMIEEKRERRERDILALVEDSLSDFQLHSPADESLDEEGSMDLEDLTTNVCGTDKEITDSETAFFQQDFCLV